MTVTFVSDVGRPGTCTEPYCGHGEFDHAVDGACRTCLKEETRHERPTRQVCRRYNPPRYFDDD